MRVKYADLGRKPILTPGRHPCVARISQVLEEIRSLASSTMPLGDLPDEHPSRGVKNLTTEEMKDCVMGTTEAV